MTHSFRLPPEYQQIKHHLQSRGTWHKTTVKFNVLEICSAIKGYVAFYGDGGDLESAFEELRDYPSVDSWLEAQGVKSDSDDALEETARDYALQELQEKASMLGFKLVGRGEVAVKRSTYDYLKRCAHQMERQRKNLNGWPF